VAEEKGHKWFAACWDWMVRNENAAIRNVRTEIVGGAAGHVLEVGCGPGSNFPYYGDSISGLIATDPDPYMLARARKRAEDVGRPIEIKQAPAGELPFDVASFDTIVSPAFIARVRD